MAVFKLTLYNVGAQTGDDSPNPGTSFVVDETYMTQVYVNDSDGDGIWNDSNPGTGTNSLGINSSDANNGYSSDEAVAAAHYLSDADGNALTDEQVNALGLTGYIPGAGPDGFEANSYDEITIAHADGTSGTGYLVTLNHPQDGTDPKYQVFVGDVRIGDTITLSQSTQNTGNAAAPMDQIVALCYARGTLIDTADGAVAVENLVAGDLVRTRDHGLQPIRWVGMRKLSEAELAISPELKPIRIKQASLGENIPAADLVVSPQHRVLIRSKIAQKMFGTDEVLIAAKHLCDIDGIDIADDIAGIDYFHILFDQHEIIFSNGAETETLYTGPMALQTVSDEARAEIYAIFPELEHNTQDPDPARMLIPGRLGQNLVRRHLKNEKSLIS